MLSTTVISSISPARPRPRSTQEDELAYSPRPPPSALCDSVALGVGPPNNLENVRRVESLERGRRSHRCGDGAGALRQ
jgi:hypothetical protein